MKNIIKIIKDCCSVRINCGKCGSGESVYFIPKSIISKLEVAVAKIETTTSTCKGSLQVGNAAKMREVLDEIRVAAMSDYEPDADYLIEKCNAALAAPPRNCDRFGGDPKMLYTAWFDWTASPSGMNDDGTVKLTYGEWLLERAKGSTL